MCNSCVLSFYRFQGKKVTTIFYFNVTGYADNETSKPRYVKLYKIQL